MTESKQSLKSKAPAATKGMKEWTGSRSVHKMEVFPIGCGTSEEGPVPLAYTASEDVLLPEDYRPTKCKFASGLLTGLLF